MLKQEGYYVPRINLAEINEFSSIFLGLQSNMLHHVEIIDNWRGIWNNPLGHILIIQNV